MTLLGLNKYLFTIEDASKLQSEFKLITPSVNLESINLKCPGLLALTEKQGVYLWLMRIGSNTYKVYAGKTKSLSRRLTDYRNGFQIHSPNDFKLQFFYTFILAHYPNAEFDLYFVSAPGHTDKENEVLLNYQPLIINERDRVSKADRDEVKKAFSRYYSSSFNTKLTEAEELPENLLPTKQLAVKKHQGADMTNHDMLASAMKSYAGNVLKTSDIWEILLRSYPEFEKGSFRPNDHGEGNKSCCVCAGTESRIFDKVGRGIYKVR